MRDRIGRAIGHATAGRAFALLWLIVAVLALPLVASAQIVAATVGVQGRAGDVSVPGGRAPDAAPGRAGLRAATPADLRFTADRSDAKPVPGGPDPFFVPPTLATAGIPLAAFVSGILPGRIMRAAAFRTAQARAPPQAFLSFR